MTDGNDSKRVGVRRPVAYLNQEFLNSADARVIRIIAEYLEPMSHFKREKIRVEDILDAFWAGESYTTIAGEFGVSPDAVEAVIRSATRRRAA